MSLLTTNVEGLCALYTCYAARYRERRLLCEETWVKRIAPPFEFVEFTGAWSYSELPGKTRRLCAYARHKDYDGLWKIDDDVYVRNLTIPDCDYGGSILYGGYDDSDRHPYATGGIYWLSKKAIEIVAKADLTADIAEDRWVGQVLWKAGIEAKPLPIAAQPCPCGKCEPKPNPDPWDAYILGTRWSAEGFRELAKK